MSAPTFFVEITLEAELQVRDVWPDGDAPANPSCADVVAVMKSSVKFTDRLASEWALGAPEVEVSAGVDRAVW